MSSKPGKEKCGTCAGKGTTERITKVSFGRKKQGFSIDEIEIIPCTNALCDQGYVRCTRCFGSTREPLGYTLMEMPETHKVVLNPLNSCTRCCSR